MFASYSWTQTRRRFLFNRLWLSFAKSISVEDGMMKRIGWKITTLILGLGLGMGGLAIQSYVAGQEIQKLRDLKMETTSETISGRVKSFLKNDKGDTDGISMENGAVVHFPPHMSTSITKLVTVGDRIEVRGHEQTLPKGEVVVEAERVEKGGQTIDIAPPRPPRGPKPPSGPRHEFEKPMSAKGTIKEFATNRHGDVDGFFLSDGTEVKLPPHQGAELQSLVKAGAAVSVEGRRHETPKGDIHLHADRIVDTASGRAIERDEPHKGRHVPPHVQILDELREIRRLVESQQKTTASKD
jgi:hypothetical protein